MVKCVVAGNIGNVGANTIVNMPITIQGIATITNDDPTKPCSSPTVQKTAMTPNQMMIFVSDISNRFVNLL